MSDLYSNYYVCSKCEKPCETMFAKIKQGPGWRERALAAQPLSVCCSASVVVKSTPYNIAASREREA